MTNTTLEQEIVEHVRTLSDEDKREVLGWLRRREMLKGVPGKTLLRFAGTLTPEEAEEMERSLKDFETINEDEW